MPVTYFFWATGFARIFFLLFLLLVQEASQRALRTSTADRSLDLLLFFSPMYKVHILLIKQREKEKKRINQFVVVHDTFVQVQLFCSVVF